MGTKINVTFNPPTKKKFTDVEGAQRAYDSLCEHVSKITGQLNSMKGDIERGGSSQSIISIIDQATAVSEGSGTGSTTSTPQIQIRCKTESFLANTLKNVSFSSTIAGTFSLSSIRVLDTTGYAVMDFTITNLTAAGFDFLCPVDGTLIYLAVEEI